MTEWVAEQPSESSAAAWAAVDQLAHAYVADGEHRSLQQARADAMIDLILGQATMTTTVDLSIPVTALPRIAAGCRRRRHGPGSPSRCSWRRRVALAPAVASHRRRRQRWFCSCRGSEWRSARIGLLTTGAIDRAAHRPGHAVPGGPARPRHRRPARRRHPGLPPGQARPGSSAAATAAAASPAAPHPHTAATSTTSPPSPPAETPTAQPDHALPAPPPPQAPRRLDTDHDPHRPRDLDQRHRPAIPHPPGRPPTSRRVSWATWGPPDMTRRDATQ